MYVKVCGITHLDDAWSAIAAGADALGFNFVPESKRFLDRRSAAEILRQVRGEAVCVAVVANLTVGECRALCDELGIDRLQLHGHESPDELQLLGPRAFKAVRVASAEDVAAARRFGGDRLLVDAKVGAELGGTGHCIDWPLVAPLAEARPLILAGGLTPENVEAAVRIVKPWAVDTASGVERDGDPRRKDKDKLRRFVQAARRSAVTSHSLAF